MDFSLENIVSHVNSVLGDYVLVVALLTAAIVFTFVTRGVQFSMVGEMCRLLLRSGRKHDYNSHKASPQGKSISSFQAFALSIASRVGTGNLAGVATAIALGGPGAVFWMWVIALLGAATAFVESTLAQLFKVRGKDSFMGGPAYYILKGLGHRWWAITFAVLISVTFGLAFNSVQSNTISAALGASFGIDSQFVAVVLTLLSLVVICGGVQRVSRFSQVVVPFMAVGYILLALVVIGMNIQRVPDVIALIFNSAFGGDAVVGGSLGSALSMGVKRGLFSNEAGEGSTPNAAATASVSHPVKQGLIQALGIYTDTLVICSATAFIILCSGVSFVGGVQGIVLTQQAIDNGLNVSSDIGSIFVCLAVFVFAFTSIVANYYYGETNIRFILDIDLLVNVYRLMVAVMVYLGAIMSLDLAWGFADITMALMTLCNLAAIALLGKYAVMLLNDYRAQRRCGHDPVYHSSTIPSIASETSAWP